MNRFDIIQFLIENNYADVNRTKSTDFVQSTCLLWAAFHGYTSLVQYLIKNGANVNYISEKACIRNDDNDHLLEYRTAVLCAAANGHFESIRLLYEAHTDMNVECSSGDNILMVVLQKTFYPIIVFLLENSIITIEEFEYAVCTLAKTLLSSEHTDAIFEYIKLALDYRQEKKLTKVCIQPIAVYNYAQECQTLDELKSIENDNHRIFIEALLIRERIFPIRKNIAVMKPLHAYGDMLATRKYFDQCLNVWIHMFYLYQQIDMETILHRFVWLFCRMLKVNERISIERFLQVGQLIFEPSQQKEKNCTLGNILCIVIIATKILEQTDRTNEERRSIYSWISRLCRQNFVNDKGKTILHLCVDFTMNSEFSFRGEDLQPYLRCPNASALRLLLTYGRHWLDIDARDFSQGNTPLHIICLGSKNTEIIELLLNSGWHIDSENKHGLTLFHLLKRRSRPRAILRLQPQTTPLKCLCARIIARKRLNTSNINSSLTKFILLHGTLHK
ncbi:hypothetical protein I4U23_012101 [Adineta vaga]|nr:hypothetical protein I4U23_012101 [Adineta vaga]